MISVDLKPELNEGIKNRHHMFTTDVGFL
ncbi:uncharacterized protein METZ01_LOCUS434484 [marine metagenome]|uniref:Uncharacterized protein n=1 Tax=marine metagenome TaxID=408172 RepID=A0A382YEU9_9ZZZZ